MSMWPPIFPKSGTKLLFGTAFTTLFGWLVLAKGMLGLVPLVPKKILVTGNPVFLCFLQMLQGAFPNQKSDPKGKKHEKYYA